MSAEVMGTVKHFFKMNFDDLISIFSVITNIPNRGPSAHIADFLYFAFIYIFNILIDVNSYMAPLNCC